MTLAAAAADGAREVRFTEVDLRAVHGTAARPSSALETFNDAERLADYDGVILCVDGDVAPLESGDVFLRRLADTDAVNTLANTVFALVGPGGSLVQRVMALGGIIVSGPRGIDGDTMRARAHGARVAKIVGWVRHALGHEHADQQHHPSIEPRGQRATSRQSRCRPPRFDRSGPSNCARVLSASALRTDPGYAHERIVREVRMSS